MSRCATCLTLLREAHELSHRALTLDDRVGQEREALQRFDADLDSWQQRTSDHLVEGAIHE